MNEDLERLTHEYLDGALDEAGRVRLADELERDTRALAEFIDHLQLHHRLGSDLGKETPLAASVIREIRLQRDSHRFARQVVTKLKAKRFGPVYRYLPLAAAACLLVMLGWMLFGQGGGPTPAGQPRGEALFVVGHLPLAPGDLEVAERLKGLGFRVTSKTAGDVSSGDTAGHALVAISATALATDLLEVSEEMRAKFRDVAVSILVWEPRLFYDLGMIAGSVYRVDWSTIQDKKRVTIVDPSHPLAAGLSGTVEVIPEPDRMSFGRVTGPAIRIATLEGEPEKSALFGYDAGAVMAGGLRAPARRVGLFLFETTGTRLTPSGWRLFDAAALWCSSTPP